MPLRYVNPAPRPNAVRKGSSKLRRRIHAAKASARTRKLKGSAKRAFLAKMAAGRARKQRRRNSSVTIRSTRGVRTLPQRPAGVPRPRPGSKPPGVPNPRRKKRRSSITKDWGAYGASRSTSPRRRKKKMARRRRRKLYGAAAAAVARKRGRRRGARRRRMMSNPAPRRRKRRKSSSRRRRSSAPRARRRRRRSVSAAAFRTYRRGHGKRRRRRVVAQLAAPSRRRRRRRRVARSRGWGSALRAYGARRRNPRRRRRSSARRRRYRRNPRPSTQRSMLRARRAIRNRYKTALGRATMKRYRMRSNPSGVIIDTLKSAAMIALPLYGARAVSFGLSGRIPGLNRVPAQFQGTVMAGLLAVIGHFATKKIGRLAKYRSQVMIGLGINFLDNALSALAPASIKTRIGLGDAYADGLGDYVQVDGTPINDDMTLSDYVEVGDYFEVGAEEELGASVEEELGLEEELGADAYLGGVQQSSMLAPIPRVQTLEPVPSRSFTKQVPRAGAGYDNPRQLYGGVFAGGFGG